MYKKLLFIFASTSFCCDVNAGLSGIQCTNEEIVFSFRDSAPEEGLIVMSQPSVPIRPDGGWEVLDGVGGVTSHIRDRASMFKENDGFPSGIVRRQSIDPRAARFFVARLRATTPEGKRESTIDFQLSFGERQLEFPIKLSADGEWHLLTHDLQELLSGLSAPVKCTIEFVGEIDPEVELEIDWIAFTGREAVRGDRDYYHRDEFDDFGLDIVASGDFPNKVRVPRFSPDGRDRLFGRFEILHPDGTATGSVRYVDDLSGIARNPEIRSLPMVRRPKGLSAFQTEYFDDLANAGIKTLKIDVIQSWLLDVSDDPDHTIQIEGVEVGINMAYIEKLGRQLKEANENGCAVYVVFLNHKTVPSPQGDPVSYAHSDPTGSAIFYGFNTFGGKGDLLYRASLAAIGKYFTGQPGTVGAITGLVVGNEINSHDMWHNLGDIELNDLAIHYTATARTAYHVLASYHPDIEIYVPIDHHLQGRYRQINNRYESADDLLSAVATICESEGDFPWSLGTHPYPENLYVPAWWNDSHEATPFHFGAEKVTYRNVEVIVQYLRQSRFLYEGKQRKIALLEQGFNSAPPGTPELQAAACAYAYRKVGFLPGIASHQMHRHVDHRDENGVRMGIWDEDPATPPPSDRMRPKPIYDVFANVDETGWEEACSEFLPLLPFRDWSGAYPLPGELSFHFDTAFDRVGWNLNGVDDSAGFVDGVFRAKSIDDDPWIERSVLIVPHPVDCLALRIRTKVSGAAQLFWRSVEHADYSEERSVLFPVNGGNEWETVVVDMSGLEGWRDALVTGIRIDPINRISGFEVDFLVTGESGDFDQDGRSDAEEKIEVLRDIDADGIPDFIDVDADGDLQSDRDEVLSGRDPEKSEVLVNFHREGDIGSWWGNRSLRNPIVVNGSLSGITTGGEGAIETTALSWLADEDDKLEIEMSTSRLREGGKVVWENSDGESGNAVFELEAAGEFHSINLEVGNEPSWRGRITSLSIFPCIGEPTSFLIDRIRLSSQN